MFKNKLKKKLFAEKSYGVFEGLKGAPSNTLKLFFRQMFFSFFYLTFVKNAFDTNSRFFSQKYARKKRKK